ncbi:hypothetical protein WJX77_007023 [Trebouxia sp. C0004]
MTLTMLPILPGQLSWGKSWLPGPQLTLCCHKFTGIYSWQCNFTAFPSTATNDYLVTELHKTLNQTEAIQPAAQLEAQLGQSYLEQGLFPQGVTNLCTFLKTHLPNSQTASVCASTRLRHLCSPVHLKLLITFTQHQLLHWGQAATAGRRRLMQTNISECYIQVSNSTTTGDTTGLSQPAVNEIASADQSASTFTTGARDLCSLGSGSGSGKANVDTSATESAENEAKLFCRRQPRARPFLNALTKALLA